ncbi:hypothetical protein GCM10007907_20980 [Chitinimonas prasina]|uniref:Transporter substrate-binding domain-containing protein n=1 Tax=Chitinimonas prasina TaxID=1434937 RepID=A0ABQ5YH25_9NEIS|nr:transporter substrate-binding domain-containing protein [Chitinimonas prasina]GLR13308.1 hypothetical protein GCM10007907_20980 [Chitinimonas prasina]
MPLSRLLLPIVCCLTLSGASAAEATWRFCHEDNETYPWIMKDREGLYATMAKLAAKRVDARIELVWLPWKRCLADVKNGVMDGVVGAGFLQERCEIGVYPGEPCKPDTAQRLYIDRFPLYRNRASTLGWDGQKVIGQRKPIAVQPGFVAARMLKQMGAQVDETDKEPYQILRKVSAGMVDGAILQAPVADPLLKEVADFGATIERLPISFQEYPTYLVVSHQRYKADPKRVKAIWQAFVQARDSNEYQAAKASLNYNEAD